MSTNTKIYTAVEVASVGPGQKEIDQTLAEVTQEAYEAAKKGKTRVVYYNANDILLTKIAQRLRELGCITELFEQVVYDSYIIVRWGNY